MKIAEKQREYPLQLRTPNNRRKLDDTPPGGSGATGGTVDFPEKQQGINQDHKLDGPLSEKKRRQYCAICHENTDHWHLECPNKAHGMGKWCLECGIPYKESCGDKHPERVYMAIKWCVICGYQGDHWEDDCPCPEDDCSEGDHQEDDSEDF